MRFEVRQGDRVIGFTDDYWTAAQFFESGYEVSGFNYPAFTNNTKEK